MKLDRPFHRLPRLARAGWSSLRSGIAILVYHRINRIDTDPFRLAVSPENFDAHLRILKNTVPVLSLRDAVQRLTDGTLPRRAAVITFDDGYADNLHFALPLLQKHGLPATVFITTHPVDAGEEFWWDELEQILLRPGRLPPKLVCGINGTAREWHLGSDADYTADQFQQHRSWAFSPKNFPTARQSIFYELWLHLHGIDHKSRSNALAEIRNQANVTRVNRSTDRVMNAGEIRLLVSDSTIEAGAHTVTHSSLATLSPAAQRQEIAQSRARMEAIVDQPVRSFSYPFGQHTDFTSETVEGVKEAGFLSACINAPATVRNDVDLYRIPRFAVLDWDARRFAEILPRWFRM